MGRRECRDGGGEVGVGRTSRLESYVARQKSALGAGEMKKIMDEDDWFGGVYVAGLERKEIRHFQ